MRNLIAFFLIIIIGCSKSEENLPAGLAYYPNVNLLEKGLVFKYYNHVTRKDAFPKTDIVYRKINLHNDLLMFEDFDAAFRMTDAYKMRIDGNQWKVIEEKSFSHRTLNEELIKELNYTISSNIHTDWEQGQAYLDKKAIDGAEGSRIEQNQKEVQDSIVDGKKCKIFYGNQKYHTLVNDEEYESYEFSTVRRYEEGLGMTSIKMTNEDLKVEMNLDEIMTVTEFERRSNHGTHRVGYIDTLQTLDDHTAFTTCFHMQKINDYYNGERAGIKGGKGKLRALLKEKLNPAKLKGQSGYLTYRFVINCRGEAGWFVTEEAGLDYEKKLFSEACRMHLYEILKEEKEWKNVVIWSELRDAYTYITFKIKNGEIIEILP